MRGSGARDYCLDLISIIVSIMKRPYRYLAIAVIVAAFIATTDSKKRGRYNQLATFNTALFPDVPDVEERTDILIQQVSSHSVYKDNT